MFYHYYYLFFVSEPRNLLKEVITFSQQNTALVVSVRSESLSSHTLLNKVSTKNIHLTQCKYKIYLFNNFHITYIFVEQAKYIMNISENYAINTFTVV